MLSRDAKLLHHRKSIQGVVDQDFLPPIMVDIDPVDGACNLDCEWCCQAASRNAYASPKFMATETMDKLGDFSKAWGIKAWRISSDSEPTLNQYLDVLIESGHRNGVDMGLITNGVLLERVLSLRRLTWLGVSLDATTADTWAKLKRSHPTNFHKIIKNLLHIRQELPDLDISIKFLRWRAVASAAKQDFVQGPLPVLPMAPPLQLDNVEDSMQLAALAKELGVNYILKDAYPKDFAKTYQFTKCRATPLGGVFGADHRFHLCCDARGVYTLTDDYTRDDWAELPKQWGSARHQELIASIQPQNCAGCAKHTLNEVLEHAVCSNPPDPKYQVNFI